MSVNKEQTKTIFNLIEDAVEILRNSKSFFKIIIKGEISNIIIEKPEEEEKNNE
jgi:hypothetical protein